MNELTINLRAGQKVPLYEQIYEYIKADIRKGRIRSGEKLPSTRALSAHLEVSRSTVELAYCQKDILKLSHTEDILFVRSMICFKLMHRKLISEKMEKNRNKNIGMILLQAEWI